MLLPKPYDHAVLFSWGVLRTWEPMAHMEKCSPAASPAHLSPHRSPGSTACRRQRWGGVEGREAPWPQAPRVSPVLCPLLRGTARPCGVSGSAPTGSGWHQLQMTTR